MFACVTDGLEACRLNKSENNSLNFTAMRFFMKLFRSSNPTLITESLFYFGVDSPSVTLETRTSKFVARYASSENKLCGLISKYLVVNTL
jgi:hypothetical protein